MQEEVVKMQVPRIMMQEWHWQVPKVMMQEA